MKIGNKELQVTTTKTIIEARHIASKALLTNIIKFQFSISNTKTGKHTQWFLVGEARIHQDTIKFQSFSCSQRIETHTVVLSR